MRGVPIAVFGSSFLLLYLLAFSEAHPNAAISDNVGPESDSRPVKERFEPRVLGVKTYTRGFVEDRLKADGFLQDTHAVSSLEHDLQNKLKAIYERYYELSEKLEQAKDHSGELTKQLWQTNLDLANYKVYKNDLINRLKKTEMYLTVLLKKSQFHIEEHQVDLNPDDYEEVADEISRVDEADEKEETESRMATVTNGNVNEGIEAKEASKDDATMSLPETVNIKPHMDTNSHVVRVEVGDEETTKKAGDADTPSTETSVTTETVLLDSQGNKTRNNGTTNEDVLAQIAFNFLRKKPSRANTPEGPSFRGGYFDRLPEKPVSKSPTGPLVKNVTVVLRGVPKKKDVKGVSVADWDFEPDLSNMGFRIFESNSNHHYKLLRGQPGSAGMSGVPGIQGASGVAGPVGKDGAVGAVGGVGQKGEPGRGVPGVNGVNGVAGVQGATGFTGPSGAPGPNGATGLKGVVGVQGPRGAMGIKGIVGAPGR